ncbi:MAG: methionyl aminopeptidase [Rhabdochlamydiaceae bacterium]|nr:methionyl aminopeptidase [Rhabdochlamydiaceae bacterium]
MFERNDPCWCGSGKKWKKCHSPELPHTPQELLVSRYLKSYGILLKNKPQIEGIRKAGHLAAQILDKICKQANVGVTTNELNTLAEKLHKEAGATAAPLGYGSPPFPKSICTSLNEVICHGIPDNRPLQEGDLLNIDVTCILDGYYGDCSRMVAIGKLSEEKQRVFTTSLECLQKATAICKPGVLICEIGKAIEDHAAEKHCSVVNQFVGHGVGVGFHEAPQVPHHYNRMAIPLVEGMTFTIEPMINAGVRGAIIDPKDHWTARTADLKPSAQWEYTLLITEKGHEILTPWTL